MHWFGRIGVFSFFVKNKNFCNLFEKKRKKKGKELWKIKKSLRRL